MYPLCHFATLAPLQGSPRAIATRLSDSIGLFFRFIFSFIFKQLFMDQTFIKQALDYHQYPTPGKISVKPTKPLNGKDDLSLAYSPGVAAACMAIHEQGEEAASRYTSRGNLVGVISNGTAVLGLGNIGPMASKPVMEGKGCLFQKFAGIDVFDIELAETDPEKLVDIIAAL